MPKPEYRQDAFILKAIVKNSGFGSKNLGIDGENLGIARLKSEILDAKLNASVRDKILQLVNEIQINQVFGASYKADENAKYSGTCCGCRQGKIRISLC